MRYALNILMLITQLIPHFLRSQQLITWLYSLSKPIETLHSVFVSFVNTTQKDVLFTGQVAVLERLLNQRFNSSGIQIIDGESVAIVYLYQVASSIEGPFVYQASEQPLQNIFLYQEGDDQNQGTDFIVRVPISLVYDETLLRSAIETYKLAGKRYKIEEY